MAQEVVMGKINWGRVFLCGLLAGVVSGGLALLGMLLFGRAFVEALPMGDPFSPLRPSLLLFSGALWLAFGIWAMWLYAAIRPRYGSGPKTAFIAGLAAWVILALADAIWGAFGVVRPGLLLPAVLVGVIPIVAATLIGAWPYKESE
jgi:hypothetical protein